MSKEDNETKQVPLMLTKWFRRGVKEAMKATDKKPARNMSEIMVRATCKVEKIKIPKGYKFRAARVSRKDKE